jgi:hypothetical protein
VDINSNPTTQETKKKSTFFFSSHFDPLTLFIMKFFRDQPHTAAVGISCLILAVQGAAVVNLGANPATPAHASQDARFTAVPAHASPEIRAPRMAAPRHASPEIKAARFTAEPAHASTGIKAA